MEGTVAALGGTLNATYKAMAANVQRSVQMAASMNSMMEQYLCRSVDIQTFVQGVDCSPNEIQLRIRVTSHCQMPIPNCVLKINVLTPEEHKEIPFEVEYDMRPENLEKSVEHKAELKKRDPRLVQNKFTMKPGTLEWKVTLEIKQMRQCNGHIELSFPSIGTGSLLHVRHTFGIYLIHRCKKEWMKENAIKIGSCCAVSFSGGFLRNFFHVPHDEGIVPGSAFKLSVAGHSLLLPVRQVKGGDVELMVHLLGASFPKEEIVEDILLELDLYSRRFMERMNPLSNCSDGLVTS
mmetsp:Transcript_9208/g.22615  ORF Transcript_9208/g.22615 Transcript_9208/m.22615 type:complete len:293 (-) Transcript_9208:191-1069(-)|eukprot:CAMPEP_0114512878 /NCGR_PEP_ID=MMETSP0109-20121206/15238_1 /TAXON_ID=29199 /ORGANISM="Chlorarachnion reptans, Strain CCCM449" /LENGTH=292 /DNA_ID=CAMNT_0001692647 /DNA_START=66 /DNA_END=944 /DNA_ORIENTATION=-